jgi:hypothetical protein
MTPAELAVRYRGYAAQCCIVAQRQDNAGDKLALVNMAQAWVALAEHMEKNESLFALYEALDSDRPEEEC